MVYRHDEDSIISLPASSATYCLRWALSEDLFQYKVSVDFGNTFGEAESLLSMYINRPIRILLPSGIPANRPNHIMSAAMEYKTKEFMVTSSAEVSEPSARDDGLDI